MKINETEPSVILADEQLKNDSSKLLIEQTLIYDGRHYDLIHNNLTCSEDFINDVPFWLDMANQYGGHILTLFCGAGRVAIPLAEAGYQVTGLDISESMLEEAKRRSSQVKWIKADASDFELDQKFSLVIVPINSLAHLIDLEVLENCLKCIRQHLKPNGKLVIDFENFACNETLESYSSKVRHLWSVYPDPDGKGTVVLTAESEVDLFEQVYRLKLFSKLLGQTEEMCEEMILRFYLPKEFETLLKYNGFTINHRFGSCNQTAFTPQSLRHIIVCCSQV